MSASPLAARARLLLRPRSVLLARVEALLARAGTRLDRLDPPSPSTHEPAPVLPLRLVTARGELPRADR